MLFDKQNCGARASLCTKTFKDIPMLIPFLALIAVIIAVVFYFISNAKKKDKGNRPSA